MQDELLRPTIGAGVDLSARPWRLVSQTYVAFFGGVMASTAIAFLNARRLGVAADQRRLILGAGAAGLVVAAVVISLLTADGSSSSGLRVAVRVVAVLACIVQLRIQRPMDRAFQLRGGEYGSLWGPGIAAVVGCGLLEAALLTAVVVAL